MESVKVSCVILYSLSSFSVLHRLPEQRCSLRSEAEPNSCLVCLRRDACVLTLWLNLYLNCVCEPHNSSVVNYRKQTSVKLVARLLRIWGVNRMVRHESI